VGKAGVSPLTDGGNTRNEAESEEDAPAPKSKIWERPSHALRWSGREVRRIIDALNWASPLLTAVATGLLVWVAIWQWIELHSTDGTLRETLRAQINSSERQLRAYVLPTSRGEIDDFGSEKPIKAILEFKNSGQTPAHKLRIRMFISAGTFPMPKISLPDPKPETRLVLGPGTTYVVVAQMGRILTVEEVNQIKSGSAAVYVFGELDYSDAFEKHWCSHFKYFMGGSASTTLPGTLTEYQDGNDEDC
jgi:hypothetical protein